MMIGVLIPPDPCVPMQRVMFDAPEDVFSKQACTIIGACVEKNLVYMGLHDHRSCVDNRSIPESLLARSVFDHTKGPILVIKTDDLGDLVDDLTVDNLLE